MSQASFLPVGSPVDVSNCEREPIHIPGSIQPHGVLISAVGPDDPVVQVSSNCADVFGVGPDQVLGTPLLELFDPSCVEALAMAMAAPPGERTAVPVRAVVRRRTGDGTLGTEQGPPVSYSALVHQVDQVWLVELEAEEVALTVEDTLLGVRSAVGRLTSATTVRELLDVAAVEIRRITGFDRVMVYRFDQDWNGQVVAEARHSRLESFLGMHYPASDIPPQARALYKVNLLRFIRDVDAARIPLVPVDDPLTGQPLDLSQAALRSVSPIHCEYLRNMGVTASMSVSLLVAGELAGLVACHHYSGPYVPSAPVRATCEFLAQTLSLTLSSREQDEATERSRRIHDTLAKVTQAGAGPESLGELMERYAPGLMEMVGATGVAWSFDDTSHTVGVTPEPEDVARVRRWADDQPGGDQVVHTDRLGLTDPALADLAAVASGVVVLRISEGQDLMFFRPEAVQTIDWGGNPHLKVLQVDADGATRLSPRGSFALWRETVRSRSAPWEAAELEAAQALTTHLVQLLYSRHRTVAMVAETLQRSLLPDRLPAPEGWSFAADSVPASAGVGGDWYDAVRLPSGQFLLAIGDVAGHGLAAASAMAQLRNALRAYAVEDDDPASILRRLDALTATLTPHELATAVVVVLDPGTGDLRVAAAGHPWPLVRAARGTYTFEFETRPPLGAGALSTAAQPESARLRLEHGEALVLVSDGMFERRGESVDVSLATLTDLVESCLADTASSVESCLAELMRRSPDTSIDDDVTLLVVRRD